MAAQEAERISVWRKGDYNSNTTRPLIEVLETKSIEDHLSGNSSMQQEFLLCMVAMSHGYLMSQFLIRGHFARIHANIDALRQALIDSEGVSIKEYLNTPNPINRACVLVCLHFHIFPRRANRECPGAFDDLSQVLGPCRPIAVFS
jgi:hypothetical protein